MITIHGGLNLIRGRPVFADIWHGTWDWQQLFDDPKLNVSGIAVPHLDSTLLGMLSWYASSSSGHRISLRNLLCCGAHTVGMTG